MTQDAPVGNITLHFNDDGSISWSRTQPRSAASVVPPPDVADLPPQEFPPFPVSVATPPRSCPVHHKPFKTNSRGFYCSTKVGDGWCQER